MLMADGPLDTLRCTISTADLEFAVRILKDMFPLTRYPEAWQALMTEHARREFMAPPATIPMRRAAFDGLPNEVKALLTKSK
jgi:hypothetical protein